jgi:hypothetical protein
VFEKGRNYAGIFASWLQEMKGDNEDENISGRLETAVDVNRRLERRIWKSTGHLKRDCRRLERRLWMSPGDFTRGCGCLPETWIEAVDAPKGRLEWRLRSAVACMRLWRRLWIHGGDLKGGWGCLSGNFVGGYRCLPKTWKKAADACRRLEWRLWISAGDKKGGCGCMYEIWKEPWISAGDKKGGWECMQETIAQIAEEIIGIAEEI